MAENTSAARVVQIGMESTPGTSVAATKKLLSVDMMGKISAEVTSQRAAGSKFATGHAVGKEWSEWDIKSEAPVFDELHFLFCSLINNVTPTTLDTSARQWSYIPSVQAEDTHKTYTIEEGHAGAANAHKAAFCTVQSVSLDISREKTELSGTMVGQNMSTGVLLTSSGVTSLPQVPVLPSDWSVFMDTTSAALGTTRLNRVLSAKLSFEDFQNTIWTVDDSKLSWAASLETLPKCTVELTMEADAAGLGPMAAMQAGTSRYLRIRNLSSTLAGAATQMYEFNLDFCGQVSEVSDFGDDQEVYTIGWTFEATVDPAWPSSPGQAFRINLINKQSGPL